MDSPTTAQHEEPTPARPPFPGPEEVRQYVEHNSTEDTGIAIGLITFHRPKNVTGAYWHWFQRWTPAVVLWFRLWTIATAVRGAAFVVPLIFCLFDVTLLGSAPWTLWPFLVVYWLHPFLVGRRARIAFAREILEQEGMVCFDCGYNLKSLSDRHTCPECGTPYEKSALQARWLEWMARKTP
jgi:hypothetical protein